MTPQARQEGILFLKKYQDGVKRIEERKARADALAINKNGTIKTV